MEGIRINKYLSEMGICSRREADRLLAEGKILVNGDPAVPGQRVRESDAIEVGGRIVSSDHKGEPVLLAFHKPRGIVCSTSHNDRAVNVIEYIRYPSRIFPIGRLDKESEGLLLMTNRGELVNQINRARYGHEKEYLVTCRKRVTDDFLHRLQNGVEIEIPVTDPKETAGEKTGEKVFHRIMTRPCRAKRVSEFSFDIVLTQGLNRQIRRMCAALGNEVERLVRIRVMNITLGSLPEGACRVIRGKELEELERLLAASAEAAARAT